MVAQINENSYRDRETDRRLKWLEDRYSIFNEEFGEVKSDVKWLVKYHWIITAASVGGLLTGLFNLMLKFST